MKIYVTSSCGEAHTLLSSFDKALQLTGVYNYNLIPLSSVIPPHSDIVVVDHFTPKANEHGHKLYVVKAEMRSNEVGKFIAAGIGWFQWGDDNRGVFVEHEVIGETQIAVESEIRQRIVNSIKDLAEFRKVPCREEDIQARVEIAQVTDSPTCVLAMAVYKSEGWD